MGAMNTMLLIEDAFVSLCDEMSMQKVSISDIIERIGKNRKTFYYHFVDKNNLIDWIFRHDLSEALKAHFPEEVLVYEKDSSESTSQFPYYIRKKSGIRSLDHSEFFGVFAKVLEKRRRFYAQALADNSPNTLRRYLYELYLPAIRSDIDLILSNRYLAPNNADFLAEFYTCGFLYFFIRKCCQPDCTNLMADAGPFANIIHDSIETQINASQLNRAL